MNTITAQDFMTAFNAALDARVAFEADKSSDNTSIVATLTSIRKSASHETIATVMLAASYDIENVNRSERVNARRNVYTLQKDVNIARSIAVVEATNHYTIAILRTALALEAADFVMTHKSASAACSQSVKHSDAKQERIISKTRYAKHIAANTASTQSSSSLNALQALSILIESRDASNTVTYRVNRDAYATIALCAKHELSLAVADVVVAA